MKSKTKIKKTPDKAIKEIERLAAIANQKKLVKVGLPKNTGNYPDGTSTIMVGAVQEFGSPSRNIPERSYLRSTVSEKRRIYKMFMRKLAKQIISGKIDMDQALNLLGLKVSSDVKDKITQISSPPLKHRDGNPLIDTGHLRRAITYQVNE